jgi:hypothetical protein
MLPRAAVLAVPRSLADASTRPVQRADALVANHVLDDMLLRAAVDASIREALFSEMQPGAPCATSFVRAWLGLMAEQPRLHRLRLAVAEDFARYVAATRPRLVVMHQYPSWTHLRGGLGFIHPQGLQVMRLVEERLLRLGHERRSPPTSLHLCNPADWLIMSRTHPTGPT